MVTIAVLYLFSITIVRKMRTSIYDPIRCVNGQQKQILSTTQRSSIQLAVKYVRAKKDAKSS